MQGHGMCLKLFLAIALLLLQCVQGGEVSPNHRDANVTGRCIEKERQALLAFKRGLVDKSDLLSSWSSEAQKQDCCRWIGVSCSNQTGHVLQLDLSFNVIRYGLEGKMVSPKLIELQHLEHLDLGYIDFNGSLFPDFIGSLINLRYLDLSWTNFGGKFPSQVGNLTNLVYLDLSANYFTYVANLEWLPLLSSLRYFDLGYANLNNVFNWLETVNKLHELTYLTLRGCDLPSPILSTLSYINSSKSLASVDLSSNQLSTSSIFLWLSNYNTSLVYLDLSYNLLAGSIPDVLGNLSSLSELILYNNQLSGGIPESIGRMSKLKTIDFSHNSLEGVISETHFSKLSKLKVLDLSSNSLVLDIHADWIPTFQLQSILLGSCKMGPGFPKWLQTQKDFSYLDISDAGISDILPSWFWISCRNVEFMNLSNNHIRGSFADLTLEFSYSPRLHLSSNKLEGPIPSVLSTASYLDLSYNKLSGSISFLCSSAATGLLILNLSSNNVSGQVPDCLPHLENLVILDLSYNALSGKIPTTIGFVFRIEILKLRSNRFVGQLPSSLKNCTSLEVVDVGYNKLSGPVPKWLGFSLKNLVILILSSNHFNGSLPSQLCHLTNIQILDLSMNNISGSIPKCLNNLTTLAQKGNPNRATYYDSIYSSNIIYIETNRAPYDFQYRAPYEDAYFEKYFGACATIMWKERRQALKSTLGLVNTIDLSSNRLTGEIPSEITHLAGLLSLNLSRNQLTCQITPEIGKLQSLDTLDLSRNQIDGRIPTSLGRINLLGFLDLSINNLYGEIPIGTQLQCFDPSAYAGNPQLCGPPLKKMCADQNVQTKLSNQEDDKDELITQGFYISMELGFAAGLWGVCSTLIFKRSWRYAYFKFLNGLSDWLYVRVALIKRQLKDMLNR